MMASHFPNHRIKPNTYQHRDLNQADGLDGWLMAIDLRSFPEPTNGKDAGESASLMPFAVGRVSDADRIQV